MRSVSIKRLVYWDFKIKMISGLGLEYLLGGAVIAFAMIFWCVYTSRVMIKQVQHKLANLTVELKRVNHYLTILQSNPDDGQINEEIDETKLYIGNIDYAASEADLAAYFAKFGPIETVNIPLDRYTGKARGFGFITFKRVADAIKAIDLDGSEFKGRQIQVNFAR